MSSPIARWPIRITGYLCYICGKYHRRGSKKFDEHYYQNKARLGWIDRDAPKEKP